MEQSVKEAVAVKEAVVAKFDAIRTEQSGTVLYVGVAPAHDLIKVTTVDRYDPKLSPTDRKQGYQRPPERSRITKIGSFLINEDGQRLFPTSVLLAAREPVEYDRKQGTVTLTSDAPIQVVDGQHRLAGLQYAIEEKGATDLEYFNVPFVIVETPDKLVEMTQFRVVNGTAKSVRTDLVNMILTATYADSKRSEIPKKDQWRIVVSNVVDRLSKDSKSPWFEGIALPGETTSGRGTGTKIVRATSFITSLRPVYTWLKEFVLDQHCRNLDDEIAYVYDIVANYWRALKDVVPDAFESADDYVIQKTPGLFSLHKLLKHLLGDMHRGRREFNSETFAAFLKESPEITDASFWHVKEQRASVYGSMKGFEDLYEILSEPYR